MPSELDDQRMRQAMRPALEMLARQDYAQAEEAFAALLDSYPGNALLTHLLGIARVKVGKINDGLDLLRKSLQLNPTDAKMHTNLAELCHEHDHDEEALAACQRAIQLAPNLGQARAILGRILVDQGEYERALPEVLRARELRPDDVNIMIDLVRTFEELGRLDEAEALARQALALDPESHYANTAIGASRNLQGRIEESIAAYAKALAKKPQDPEVQLAQAANFLVLGDMKRGWAGYEWRLHTKNYLSLRGRKFYQPRWDGSPLNGRRILLHWEQGFGDTIQFCRFAPLVARLGGRVLVETRVQLVRLLQSLEGVEQVIAHEPMLLPPFDVHCPLMSVPYVVGMTLENIPPVPYLHASPQDADEWRARLGRHDRLRVALAWSGFAKHSMNRRRSIPLESLAPILAVPDVSFYSLQLNGAAEIAQVAPGKIMDLAPHIKDFADTAAALSQMDLVISVDTSMAHLAGALNVPVWMMLYFPGEWRWLLNRTDSPWYPSMRIFRQKQARVWAPTIQEVAAALRQRSAKG